MKREQQLLPDRHPQAELFICDIGDAALKDDMASMEHPIFALSKKPDMKRRSYQNGSAKLEIRPSDKGIATIWDKDILIFAISQLMAAKKVGRAYQRKIVFSARDFLIFSNRGTGGTSYKLLVDALERLDGTRITTSIKTGGEETTSIFGLIDEARIVREDGNTGRVLEWSITISEWLYRAIEADEVLTIHKDYFRLKRPLERRVYEVARKHCGLKESWKIGLDKLHLKTGSSSPMKRFKQLIKELIEFDHMPDYAINLEDDMVVFTNRHKNQPRPYASSAALVTEGHLLARTWEQASKMASQAGVDKYEIFEHFKSKIAREGHPEKIDGAFLAYLRKVVESQKNKREQEEFILS